ncbi:transmembrane protein 268 isoform X2 [Columba livia]|uniref:transmembrane protein 268 isoform X2 n=1 Tax=Columba livia TaxID=8932 RepID=UPI0031BB0054
MTCKEIALESHTQPVAMTRRAQKCLLAHGKQDLEEAVSGSVNEDFTIWSPTRRASCLGLNPCFLALKDKADTQSAEFLTIRQRRGTFSMAHKTQADGIEKNGSLSSVLYKSDLTEGSLQWVQEPLDGQVLLVLCMDNNCSATAFDMELCVEKLKSLGVQVAADQCRRLIQDAVLKPEVRRYMFYNSRAFQIAIAVVFYVSLWTNIYSTVRLCSFGRYWEASVLVTLAAVLVTVVVILVLDRRQRKINMNTDARLAAVNEILIKHSLILGITDALDGPHNILQLWFVRFSPERCLQSLSAHITDLQRTRESGLRRSLDQLCVVMEAVVHPDPGTEEETPCEESPLLSKGRNPNKKPVTCNELLRLVPDGPPEVMAQQLLVIFSGCYVRLLVTGRLPGAGVGGHLEHSSVPCLCQFVKTTTLNTQQSWFMGR